MEFSPELFIYIAAIAMIIAGLAGTLLPVLPSTPLILAGMLLLAWHTQFTRIGWPSISILIAITVLSMVLDYIAGALGAKRVGASPQAIWGALIGSIVGILGGILGLILGPFIGAALGEWYARRDILQASKAGLASGIGMLLGAIAKIALALAMIGVFILAWFI